MVYPIITDYYRCQVVMQGSSSLPTDQFVNNWYFRNDNAIASADDIASDMKNVLDAFYGAINGTATQALSGYLPDSITGVTYKVYDLGAAAPRYPIVEPQLASWVGTSTGPELPREVAKCLSFKAGNGPRRRGRVYIGPLTTAAVAAAASGGGAIPLPAFETVLGESAENVLNSTENVTWAVVSPTDAGGFPVVEAWVDDAFDTQRSRGREPTTRRTWTAAGEVV